MDNKEIFTSVVRVKGSERYKVIPVKSSAEVEKSKWIQLSKVISRLYVSVPIKKGSIIGFAFDGDNVTKLRYNLYKRYFIKIKLIYGDILTEHILL